MSAVSTVSAVFTVSAVSAESTVFTASTVSTVPTVSIVSTVSAVSTVYQSQFTTYMPLALESTKIIAIYHTGIPAMFLPAKCYGFLYCVTIIYSVRFPKFQA